MQGHGPQRLEGAVTRQMLIDRVLLGIDPMTGTRMDGERTGRLHIVPRTASRIASEADCVAAESYIRRTVEFRDARDLARTFVGVERPRFEMICLSKRSWVQTSGPRLKASGALGAFGTRRAFNPSISRTGASTPLLSWSRVVNRISERCFL